MNIPEDLMKRSVLITLSTAFLFSTFNLYAVDTLYTSFNDDVKNYTQINYNVTSKFGEYYRTVDSKTSHILDENGREIEVAEYTSKDILIDKVTNSYDSFNNLTESVFTDSDGKILIKTVYTYDEGGILKDETEYDNSGNLIDKTIYKNETGKNTQSLYDSNGKLLTRIITTYKNNLKERVEEYSGDGLLQTLDLYSYNSKGKILQILHSENFEDNSKKYTFKYDANSILTEIQVYNNASALIERDIYKSDSSGNTTRVSVYSVAKKFGTTTNELESITEFSF